jgi:hypothetical protein
MTPKDRQRRVGMLGVLLLGMGIVTVLRNPGSMDRGWTPTHLVGVFALLVAMNVGLAIWTTKRLTNAAIKRRWLAWLLGSMTLYAAFVAAALLDGPSSLRSTVLAFATKAAWMVSGYELAGTSADDWVPGRMPWKA